MVYTGWGRILEATSDEPRSASKVSETCDMPLSTAYRKLDKLTEASLLEEQIRISRSGKHTSEYALVVENVTLQVDGGFEISGVEVVG